MTSLDDLYLRFDGTIPPALYDRAKAGDLATCARQIARAAERQFECIIHETQAQIRHYRIIREPILSTTTLNHLSRDLLYHRNRAMEARAIAAKNAA